MECAARVWTGADNYGIFRSVQNRCEAATHRIKSNDTPSFESRLNSNVGDIVDPATVDKEKKHAQLKWLMIERVRFKKAGFFGCDIAWEEMCKKTNH